MKAKLRRNLIGEVQEKVLDSLDHGKEVSVDRLIKEGDELNDIVILFNSLARLYHKGLININCRASKNIGKILTNVGYLGFKFDGRFKNAFENRTKMVNILKRSTKPLSLKEVNERLSYAGVKMKDNTLSKNLSELIIRGLLKRVGCKKDSAYALATRKVKCDSYESDARARIVNILKQCELPVRSKYILEELNKKSKMPYSIFIRILVNMETDRIVERSGFTRNNKWKLKE